MTAAAELDAIASKMLSTFGDGELVARVTEEHPGYTLDDAYRVAHRIRDLRVARGERVVGRKIGGTNRALHALLGVKGPLWGFMYDTTVRELDGTSGTYEVGRFRQPRIEPELILHVATPPRAGMSEAELIGCIDRVAHGFEFVHSPYSTWKVAAPDSVSAFGLHQGLLIGPWHDIGDDRAGWMERLKTFGVTLRSSAGEERSGVGANVLGSPILAFGAIVEHVAEDPDRTPIGAGEVITTGTITELMPAIPGETWTTTISGAPLEGLTVTLV